MTTRGKTLEVLAYAAGFIDGEGSIGIARANPRKGWHSRGTTPRYEAHVTVVNTVREPMEWLYQEFGGHLRNKKPGKEGWKPQYCWVISNRRAVSVLRELLPYLKVKRSQADLLIAFMDGKTLTPKRYRLEVPPEEVAWREDMRQKMLALNSPRWNQNRSHPQRLSESAPKGDFPSPLGEATVCPPGKPGEVGGTETTYPA